MIALLYKTVVALFDMGWLMFSRIYNYQIVWKIIQTMAT